MMEKKKILICDDDRKVSQIFKEQLEEIDVLNDQFNIDFLREDFEETMDALERRLKAARNGEIDDYPNDAAKKIDETDILVVDYNLFDFNPMFTGERIAYLARCYSKSGIIVALNQYEPYVEEYFDLSLNGHPESYADLNIPSNSLSNPGLWLEPWDGFRPWYWPLLPLSSQKFERRSLELQEHLDESIFGFFDFDDTKSIVFPRSSIEFIKKTKNDITFREFVTQSGNGLRGRGDKPISDESIARIAAARIGTWLEHVILPSQDILVDAPHLVSRYNSLLLSKEKDGAAFDRVATFSLDEESTLNPVVEQTGFRFEKEDWLSRPTWFWNKISNYEDIPEVSDPWSTDQTDLVFAEDVSRFIKEEEAHRFVADLESAFVRRFVKKDSDVKYVPQVRFSL